MKQHNTAGVGGGIEIQGQEKNKDANKDDRQNRQHVTMPFLGSF